MTIAQQRASNRSGVSTRVTLGVAALLFGAACGDPTATERVPLEALPFDAIGTGRLVFERMLVGDGLYLADGVARSGRALFTDVLVRGAVLSPNGRRLAYSRVYGTLLRELRYDLAVRDIETGAETRLTEDEILQGMPTWTPTGDDLVYPSNEVWGSIFDYWQTPANAVGAPARRNLTRSPATRCSYGEFAVRAVLSVRDELAWPCLDRIYVKSNAADARPLDVDGSGGDPLAVAWSPDGLRLAYAAFLGDQLVVKVVARGGGTPTTIASVAATPSNWSAFNRNSLCWTADGARLFFNATRGNESSHVWVVRSDGRGLQQVTSRPGAFDYNVSCT